jgi:hypothetical protein
MIPNNDSQFYPSAKYLLLEEGDIMINGDQYYNNFTNRWLPVEREFIGGEYIPDESKPVRRKNAEYLTWDDVMKQSK